MKKIINISGEIRIFERTETARKQNEIEQTKNETKEIIKRNIERIKLLKQKT